MQKLESALLESLLQTAAEGVVIHDAASRIVFANQAAERMLGLNAAHIVGLTSNALEDATVHEDGSHFPASEHPAMVTLRSGRPCTGVIMGIQPDPARPCTWLSVNSGLLAGPPGEDANVFTVFSDITSHVESERRLRDLSENLERANSAVAATEARLRAILHTIPDLVWTKDLNGVYIDCNPEFERFFGAPEAAIQGKTDYDFVDAQLADSFRENDATALAADGPSMNEEVIKYASDGHSCILETIKTPMRDAAGRVIGVLGIARNITARRDVEDQLRLAVAKLEQLKNEFQELSRTDSLTGLANRRAFDEAMKTEFLRFARFGAPAALLMIDIDRFKRVNDAYGHEAGDRALVAVARTLKEVARATDLAARFGGEEFVVLLAGTTATGATYIAQRIRRAIGQIEFAQPPMPIRLTVSIGVTTFNATDRDASEVVCRADHAMYRAKALGRNRVASSGEISQSKAVS